MQVTKYGSRIPVSELRVHDILVVDTADVISSINAKRHSGEVLFNLKSIGSSSKAIVDRRIWSDRVANNVNFYSPVTVVRYSDKNFDRINDSMCDFKKSLNAVKNGSPNPVEQIISVFHRSCKGLELYGGIDLFKCSREIKLHCIIERMMRDKLDNCLGTMANRQTDFAYVSSYNLAKCILAGEGIEELRKRLEISNTASAEASRLKRIVSDAWKI